jgi:hypothetical protein
MGACPGCGVFSALENDGRLKLMTGKGLGAVPMPSELLGYTSWPMGLRAVVLTLPNAAALSYSSSCCDDPPLPPP